MSTSILEHLREHARVHANLPAYGEKIDGSWKETDWESYDRQIRTCARGLMTLGLGSRQTVAILGINCPQWAIACLGTMSSHGISVGIYRTSSPQQVAYILNHAEAPIAVVEDRAQLAKIQEVRDQVSSLQHVVLMSEASVKDEEGIWGWQDLLDAGAETSEDAFEERFQKIQGDDTATFIYTSGTTGEPKAVMLSHSNLLNTGRIGNDLHGFSTEDSIISYLPLAHVAEQMMSVHMPAYVGYTVYYAEAPEKLLDHLLELRPTIFFAVPRVWEKFYAKISERLEQAGPVSKALLSWTIKVGGQYTEIVNQGRTPGLGLRLRWKFTDSKIAGRLRGRLGMDNIRLAASGAAPITREILDFFAGIGVCIYEVYGLSETCGPGTWNSAGATKLGTVGPALPEVELRLDEGGEVLFRGPNVFQGYFKNEENTRAALDDDGWFHTGDLGAVDADGYLTITGRKKELIITSGGKNIAPNGIESKLKEVTLIGDAMVVGDNRRFLVALLTVEEEGLATVKDRNPDLPAHEDPAVRQVIVDAVQAVNRQLARVETVRNIRILAERLSPDTGELTPTLKLRRAVIQERYAAEIDAMYEEGQTIRPDQD